MVNLIPKYHAALPVSHIPRYLRDTEVTKNQWFKWVGIPLEPLWGCVFSFNNNIWIPKGTKIATVREENGHDPGWATLRYPCGCHDQWKTILYVQQHIYRNGEIPTHAELNAAGVSTMDTVLVVALPIPGACRRSLYWASSNTGPFHPLPIQTVVTS